MSESGEDKVTQIIIAKAGVNVETVNPGDSLAVDLGFELREIVGLAEPIRQALGVDLPLIALAVSKISNMTVGQLTHAATALTGVVSRHDLERALDEGSTPEQAAAEAAYCSVVDGSPALKQFLADLSSGVAKRGSGESLKWADDNIGRLTRCAVDLCREPVLLTAMARCGESWVRASVARNPHTPSDVRKRLESDLDPNVQRAARESK
jgi:hypothetical protein